MASEWQVVGAKGKHRPERATTVAPAPKLSASPRKGTASQTLSSPLPHQAPPQPVLETPKRAETSQSSTKTLSPVVPHTAPGPSTLPAPVPHLPPDNVWARKAAEKATAPKDTTPSSLPAPQPVPATSVAPPRPRKTTAERVLERGYPLGFDSEKDFRDKTRPIAKLARDGVVFVSGSSVTGESYTTGRKFGSHSDIDVGVASPTLREDSTQVQQSGPGTAFPARGSKLEQARGRTRERHPIGAKVFYGVPSERTVLIREHTPEGKRDK